MALALASRSYPAVMTCVYRLYDVAGTLLYVGVAYDFDTRFAQHAAHQPWWPRVAHRDVIWFDNRLDACYEEARAIAHEAPAYNDRAGIWPIALVIVHREIPPSTIKRGTWQPAGEAIVSKSGIRAVADEVVDRRSHALVAVEGRPIGVMVPRDWYEQARAHAGEHPVDLDAVPATDVSVLYS